VFPRRVGLSLPTAEQIQGKAGREVAPEGNAKSMDGPGFTGCDREQDADQRERRKARYEQAQIASYHPNAHDEPAAS
jgi:hypothetical protein